jgi:hypothetical protein
MQVSTSINFGRQVYQVKNVINFNMNTLPLQTNKMTSSCQNILSRYGQQYVTFIDLVLIDQQSVGKRSLLVMDTVNAEKRWTIIYWRINKSLKESHIMARLDKKRVSFLLFYSVRGNANSLVTLYT